MGTMKPSWSPGRHARRGAFLTEILVALAILVAVLIPLFNMITVGRHTTEHSARRLQALYICEKVLEQVSRDSILRFDALVAEPTPQPLVADGTGAVSHYFEKHIENPARFDREFPFLREHLGNFRLQVEVDVFEGSADLKNIRVTVFYRLSPGHQKWHPTTMETVLVRRVPY